MREFVSSSPGLVHLSPHPDAKQAQEAAVVHRCSRRVRRREWPELAIAITLTTTLWLVSLQEAVSSHSLSPGPSSGSSCGDVFCLHGTCVDGRCICDRGWQGSACHRCSGRLLLDSPSGFITDGSTNYSTDLQCTWLIDSGSKSSVIRLQLTEFETECSWDHLYIFDGDSVFSPLVAAYSGLLIRNGHQYQEVPEVVARSGKAYLYFYSDAAYNMSGFNVSYTVNGCPQNCSRHGACSGGSCICDGGWDGDACDREICPNSCSGHGHCDTERRSCFCKDGWSGSDCSQRKAAGVWELLAGQLAGRALHAAAVEGSSMWVAGGECFTHPAMREETPFLIRYDFFRNVWQKIPDGYRPDHRFGHTMTLFDRKLYLYGGTLTNGSVSNELWIYDLDQRAWSLRERSNDLLDRCPAPEFCAPIAAAGHTATLVDDKIILIFGHNSVYGYLNTVQEYNLTAKRWSIAQTHGALVKGGFGHSAALDPDSKMIYVYGGYHSHGSDSVLMDLLYVYETSRNYWKLLNPSQSPRYLHSAVILNGAMIVFGGNGHNATHDKAGDKCFSPQVLMYDIECDAWQVMHDPAVALKRSLETGRYGHSCVIHDKSVYFYGGFNGLMLNSILKFTPGECSDFSGSAKDCNQARPGAVCIWNQEKNMCISKSSSSSFVKNSHISFNALSVYNSDRQDRCERRISNFTDLCHKLSSCPSCLENTFGCVWCSDSCHFEKCKKPGVKGFTDILRCDSELMITSNCDKLHNCQSCHTEPHCGWQRDNKCYTFVKDVGNKTQKAVVNPEMRPVCEVPCHQRTSCVNCSAGPSCMWCSSLQRCIESNAYAAAFPIAQCMEWTIHKTKCTNCSDIQTCDACQLNPRCGWCDDGSGTGVGRCMEGAGEGPYSWTDQGVVMMPEMCKSRRWFFTSCPLCQCNGHSTCLSGTSECRKPCGNLTEGSHCQYCQEKYFGDPVNGGSCKPCFCHHHSEKCNRTTGKCHCTTKGISGDTCDRCDEQNHYFGGPTEQGGTCYYNLTIDFQYTFNMSKSDDKYLTRINFMNVPMKTDVDVDFTISCSKSSLVNISIGSSEYRRPVC